MTLGAGGELRTVVLRQLPVPLWLAHQQHTEELLREFTLISTGRERDHEQHTPSRLIALVETLRERYGAGSEERAARVLAAAEQGILEMDLEMELPTAAAEGVSALVDLLDEADDYCRQGQHLLTLATPPQLVLFRRWYLTEVAEQLRGAAPVPWPSHAPGRA